MSDAELKAQIKEKTEGMEKLESDFKAFTDGLQKSYTAANEKKEKDVKDIQDSGLGLMKAVKAHQATTKTEL